MSETETLATYELRIHGDCERGKSRVQEKGSFDFFSSSIVHTETGTRLFVILGKLSAGERRDSRDPL